jgi:hypothetical protein
MYAYVPVFSMIEYGYDKTPWNAIPDLGLIQCRMQAAQAVKPLLEWAGPVGVAQLGWR